MARTSNHNRQDSLEKALQLFWRKGFHATSLKDIEKALDMRPGSIYAAFGSKEGLFQEALERYAQQSLQELKHHLASFDSPLSGLTAFIRGLGGLRDQDLPSCACMLVKSLLELSYQEQGSRQKADNLLASMEAFFTTCFIAAQEAGELDTTLDPVRLSRRLQAEIMGLRAFAERDVENEAVQAVADDMALSLEALSNTQLKTQR